jgi:hypothetical protein
MKIITAEINTQELEAYYLLESLRKFPFSETRDAVRLNGFSLAGIIEYCMTMFSSPEETIYANMVTVSSLSLATSRGTQAWRYHHYAVG